MDYETLWIAAFIATCLIELPIYLLGLYKRFGLANSLVVGLIVNAVSHPILWFVVPQFSPYIVWLILCELMVIALEAILAIFYCKKVCRKNAPYFVISITSILANVLSTMVGIMFF
jgi:hypothetical protein